MIPEPEVGHSDFLARADVLGALGFDVLISRFEQDFRVAEYLARYTERLNSPAARWRQSDASTIVP
jgi:hypothetical protein